MNFVYLFSLISHETNLIFDKFFKYNKLLQRSLQQKEIWTEKETKNFK